MQEEITSEPLVSVIIPCYNSEAFIAETIESALKQSYSNIEIICINDGSTDNSECIIKKINDKRLNYIFKKNTGVSDTRNQGLKNATGAAPKAAPVASSAPPPADASLGDTLGQLLHVDADAARASLTGELGPVFEHGGVCFCAAA